VKADQHSARWRRVRVIMGHNSGTRSIINRIENKYYFNYVNNDNWKVLKTAEILET